MEFSLEPFHKGKANVTVSTPYLCTERYDGSRWTDYPDRKGPPKLSLRRDFDGLEASRYLRINRVPLEQQDAFLQQWLYFGLLAELMGANYTGDPEDGLGERFSDPATSTELLDTIYDTVLVQESDRIIVVLENDGLQKFVNRIMSTIPQDLQGRKVRYQHLIRCLEHANDILYTVAPKDMNHAVRVSIAVLGDIFSNIAFFGLRSIEENSSATKTWAEGYFNDDIKLSMMENGWCHSDIARCQDKFTSTQSLNILHKMDRSQPGRDHSRCTEYVCDATRIDMENYHVGHLEDDCTCSELFIDSDEITGILLDGNKIPLLRFVGGTEDLKAEVVESTSESKYIAISHVWADGLGNPRANALHRCKLYHLRNLVAEVASEANESRDGAREAAPLIWIDTLCCPALEGDGKKKGIEKIYNVYERAEHVLVLDSGLMSYTARDQDISEQALRIFTSSWVRRLWTLQEGALAHSLYFQFADTAIPLQQLYEMMTQTSRDSLQHRSLGFDFEQEYWELRRFFHDDDILDSTSTRNIGFLDRALQFRGVSVATDEPLCIGALLRLDLVKIINARPKADRMKMVWKLLAERLEGLPARIIFFDEPKIDADGWRWALRSLLDKQNGLIPSTDRVVEWTEGQMGTLTSRGLRVKFSGYHIKTEQYTDGKPRNPWPGLPRMSENYMNFKNTQTGQWYFVADKAHLSISQGRASDEQRQEYNENGLFPLHDLADTEDTMIICSSTSGQGDAIFAIPDGSDALGNGKEDVIHVRAQRHILVYPAYAEYGYLFNTIQNLALRLRENELTGEHLEIFKRLVEESGESSDVFLQKLWTDEEFRASLETLKQTMKDAITETVSLDARFAPAAKASFGESFLDRAWVLIADYFRHGYIGTPLRHDQIWVID